MRKALVATVGVVATALAVSVPTTASAHAPKPKAPKVTVLTTQVGAPFNLDVSRGRLLVADGFANQVGKVLANGTVKTVVPNAPGTAGVATKGSRLAYTTAQPVDPNNPGSGWISGGLNIVGPRGKKVYADLLAYEKKRNPDRRNHYGIKNPTQCMIDTFAKAGIPASYTGQIDSHAYSVASVGKRWIVADAGGNNLLWVDNKGRIKTLTVLPPQPVKITAAMAAAQNLDACVVGQTYKFEPVPTDVEVGKGGWLYVTTLPGGPEDASFGARGKVYKVHPRTGRAHAIARGISGATNLAIGQGGQIFVTEFYAGRVSVVRKGTVKPYVNLPGAVSVEAGPKGSLYAGTLVFGPAGPPTASVVKITR